MNVFGSRRAGSVARVTVPLVLAAAAVWAFGATPVAAAPTALSEHSATGGESVVAFGAMAATGPTSSFDTALYQAFDACLSQSVVTDRKYTLLSPTGFYQCLGARGYSAVASAPAGPGDLTSRVPAPSQFEVDLFRAFTSCLAEAAHPDSMYPGIDPAEVNNCLERYGF